jgi:hypothetical protein
MLQPKSFSFQERLKEIDRFFQGRSAVHRAMRRLVRTLEQAGIVYAIIGGMAVNAHGHRQTTDDVDVVLTPEGFDEFHRDAARQGYARLSIRRGRRFLDLVSKIPVDIVLSGSPCSGRVRDITYPDPATAGAVFGNIRFVSLVELIRIKLAVRRYRDLGDVVALIRSHGLDGAFLEKLPPPLQADFVRCLEELRREREWEET